MFATTHSPTAEQSAILTAVRDGSDNLMLNAYAGTGKTTTLELIDAVAREAPALYLVFNKRNADEAIAKQKDDAGMRNTTVIRTLNSLGHRIWAQACGGKKLDLPRSKVKDIFYDLANSAPKGARNEMWSVYSEVIDGVAMAKALGYVPDGKFPTARRLIDQGPFHAALDTKPDDFVADLIDAVLTKSIQLAYNGVIDYNDQLYMPALFGGIFPKFPLVMVDEFQDLSPVNHALLDKLVHGRVIGVGDRLQNIYGFRGAKAAGMDDACDKFSCVNLPLSVSFRCPQAVVEAARWHAPDFQWIRPGGHVENLPSLHGPDVHPNVAFLCRNNAPLFRLAFQLITSGHSVNVAGSDIGPRLVGMMKRLGSDEMNQAQTLAAIDDWLAEREAKESKSAHDYAECMRVFARQGRSLGQAISYAEHLFAQSGTIQLLTGHKSKGMEFETVYILDPWLCKPEPQDNNLRYVMQTRSLDTLFEIDSRSITWTDEK